MNTRTIIENLKMRVPFYRNRRTVSLLTQKLWWLYIRNIQIRANVDVIITPFFLEIDQKEGIPHPPIQKNTVSCEEENLTLPHPRYLCTTGRNPKEKYIRSCELVASVKKELESAVGKISPHSLFAVEARAALSFCYVENVGKAYEEAFAKQIALQNNLRERAESCADLMDEVIDQMTRGLYQ